MSVDSKLNIWDSLPNSLPPWCIIGIGSSPNKQVSSLSNTNARTRQQMQSSSPMDPSTLRNSWQRASISASQMRSTRRATINQHPLPGKDHHHQNSAETQTGEGCIPPSWQAWPGGFGTTAFRPQQAQRTHAQETKNRSFHQRVPVVRRTTQQSMFFRDVTDTNQSESHSGHQQLRFTRNYMGHWMTWRRPPTSSLLLDWSCRRTRRRKRRPWTNTICLGSFIMLTKGGSI